MTEFKPLQMFQNENGEPGERFVNGSIDVGLYDISLGKEFLIFLHNPNHNIIADISDLDTENDSSTFHGPKIILPMETVKCSWKIKAVGDKELENINAFTEDITHDRIAGTVLFQKIELILENGNRPWGWKKNA